jgi:hypothetical protein
MKLYMEGTRAKDRVECLSADELAHIGTEELSQEQRHQMLAHLAACSDCAEEYRIVCSLKTWSGQMAAAHAGDQAETNSASRDEMESHLIGSKIVGRKSGGRLSTAGIAYALAASLLIVVVALAAWLVSIRSENRRIVAELERERTEHEQSLTSAHESLEEARRQLEDASRPPAPDENGKDERVIAEAQPQIKGPQLNVPITDLDPKGSLRGGNEDEATMVRLPSGSNLFALILNITGEHNYSNYGLEIEDRRGKLIWQGRGLRKSQDNTSTIALPREMFPAGRYQLKLYGLDRERKELIQTYAVRIKYD